jgi:hypothetical protein
MTLRRFLLPLLAVLLAATACSRPAAPKDRRTFLLPSATRPESEPIAFPASADNVRLLVFIHPTDPVCMSALEHEYSAILGAYSAQGFSILAAIPTAQTHPPVLPEIVAMGLPFPVGYAEADMVEAYGGEAALHAIPTIFLLGKGGGEPLRKYPGYPDGEVLRRDIEAALAGEPLPPPPAMLLPEENAA